MTANNRFPFTKTSLEAIKPPEASRDTYLDSRQPGLQLRVTSAGSKTFVCVRKVVGKPVRATLGKFPAMTIDQARRQAAQKCAEMMDGINPNDAKKAARARGVTLSECLEDYLSFRSGLAESTAQGYRSQVKTHLKDWISKPLKDISRDMVAQRHRRIAKEWPVAANNVMRTLRALFNFAAGHYEGINGEAVFTDNPTKRISHNRQWTPEKRRQTIIKAPELPIWFEAVARLRGEDCRLINEAPYVTADYLEFVLLTGLRRDDALSLRWDQVELESGTMRPVIHKKKKEEITLPLSKYVTALLACRKRGRVNEYVFPGRYGKGRMDDPKKQIAKVSEWSGIKFSSHDLRRTFITVAGSLDLSEYVVKRLCTHTISNDVTGGYMVFDAERLRRPSQKVEDMVLSQAGLLKSAKVQQLPRKSVEEGAW